TPSTRRLGRPASTTPKWSSRTPSCSRSDTERAPDAGRAPLPGCPSRLNGLLEVHATAIATGNRSVLLRLVGDDSLRGEEQARDGCRVLQSGTRHLRRVDDALREQVTV